MDTSSSHASVNYLQIHNKMMHREDEDRAAGVCLCKKEQDEQSARTQVHVSLVG